MKDFHCEVAQSAFDNMPNDVVSTDLADLFKIFADTTRVKLLFAIKNNELCVHDISLILGMQQSAVSHQLKILRHNKVVSVRRQGQKSFYSLNDHHIFEILNTGLIHISHK